MLHNITDINTLLLIMEFLDNQSLARFFISNKGILYKDKELLLLPKIEQYREQRKREMNVIRWEAAKELKSLIDEYGKIKRESKVVKEKDLDCLLDEKMFLLKISRTNFSPSGLPPIKNRYYFYRRLMSDRDIHEAYPVMLNMLKSFRDPLAKKIKEKKEGI